MQVLKNEAPEHCDICNMDLNGPQQMTAHRKGRRHQNKVRRLHAGGAGPAAYGRNLDGDGDGGDMIDDTIEGGNTIDGGDTIDGRIDDGWTSWQDQIDQQAADPAFRKVSVHDRWMAGRRGRPAAAATDSIDDGWGGVSAEQIGVDRNDGWGGLASAPAGPEAAAQIDWTETLLKF